MLRWAFGMRGEQEQGGGTPLKYKPILPEEGKNREAFGAQSQRDHTDLEMMAEYQQFAEAIQVLVQ